MANRKSKDLTGKPRSISELELLLYTISEVLKDLKDTDKIKQYQILYGITKEEYKIRTGREYVS